MRHTAILWNVPLKGSRIAITVTTTDTNADDTTISYCFAMCGRISTRKAKDVLARRYVSISAPTCAYPKYKGGLYWAGGQRSLSVLRRLDVPNLFAEFFGEFFVKLPNCLPIGSGQLRCKPFDKAIQSVDYIDEVAILVL